MAEAIKTPSASGGGDAANPGLSASRGFEDLARSVLEEGNELGTEMLAVLRENATEFYREQRDRAANEIGAMAELLHNSVRSMERSDAVVARCADEAASQIDDFAAWLRGRSWGELTGDVEGLARRYPLSFLSAAAGMGFLAARLLAASADQGSPERIDEQSPRPSRTRANGQNRGAAVGEREIVAGVAGGAAAERDVGTPGKN